MKKMISIPVSFDATAVTIQGACMGFAAIRLIEDEIPTYLNSIGLRSPNTEVSALWLQDRYVSNVHKGSPRLFDLAHIEESYSVFFPVRLTSTDNTQSLTFMPCAHSGKTGLDFLSNLKETPFIIYVCPEDADPHAISVTQDKLPLSHCKINDTHLSGFSLIIPKSRLEHHLQDSIIRVFENGIDEQWQDLKGSIQFIFLREK